MNIDITKDPIGQGKNGPVYLKDLWPTGQEIQAAMVSVTTASFTKEYADVFSGDDMWRSLPVTESETYDWQEDSTYIRKAPFFDGLTKELTSIKPIKDARILALFGDSITTDHISPAGAIKADSPAGHYLQGHNITPLEFNTYGSRRGNHEVMMRGTFANIRIRNQMAAGTEGGFTKYLPTDEVMSIYDACMKYKEDGVGLVVLTGKDYGMGSSRDWAAKGPNLLGVKTVIAESYERIHRSNLVMMGVLPLQFLEGESADTLGLDGTETYAVTGLEDGAARRATVAATAADGRRTEFQVEVMLLTPKEVEYFRNGGLLHYVLRQLAAKDA